MSYAAKIQEVVVGPNPRHVEAWMRLEHPTLDGLSEQAFKHEVLAAVACMAQSTEAHCEALALSYGL